MGGAAAVSYEDQGDLDHSPRFLFWGKTAAQLGCRILKLAPGAYSAEQGVPGALDGKLGVGEEVGLSRERAQTWIPYLVQTEDF